MKSEEENFFSINRFMIPPLWAFIRDINLKKSQPGTVRMMDFWCELNVVDFNSPNKIDTALSDGFEFVKPLSFVLLWIKFVADSNDSSDPKR